jgi:hypothetical protein
MTTHGRKMAVIMLFAALCAMTRNVSADDAPEVAGQHNLQRSPGDNPPIPLPASGKPGDVISVSSQRNGGLESWTYKWRAGAKGGGSWSLIGYTFKYFDEQER